MAKRDKSLHKKRGRKPHLTPEQAAEVREMYAGPWRIFQIAHFFKVSRAVIVAAIDKTGAYRDPH